MFLRSLLLSAFLLMFRCRPGGQAALQRQGPHRLDDRRGQTRHRRLGRRSRRVLHRASKGGDIFTAEEYGDYELTWEWKISPGGNSGLKYRVMQISWQRNPRLRISAPG